MRRRELLKRAAALTGAGLWGGPSSLFAPHSRPETSGEGQVMTVRGPIAPEEMGPALPHEHIRFVETMRGHDLLDRVLLSHDGSSYPPDGTELRPYDTLFRSFLSELRSAGFREKEVHQLTVENPRRAFTVRIRT